MNNRTFYLNRKQYRWLAKTLPQPCVKTGNPYLANEQLLGGILYVLKTGCRWQDIPASVCRHHYSSCWRRFDWWRRQRAVILTWRKTLELLDRNGSIDLTLCNVDGSLVQSPHFQDGTGYSGKHHRIGTNLVMVTEKDGLPLTNTTAKGNRHDMILAQKVVSKIRIGAKRRVKQLNGDKGFDGRAFRQHLRKMKCGLY